VLLIRYRAMKASLVQPAIVVFISSFAFLCTRYALLLADSSVPIGYRFEASIVDLLQKLGIVLLFAAVVQYTRVWKPVRFGLWALLAIYAALSLAYIVLSFIVSQDALNSFKEDWRWHFSDRDFGLTYSAAQIERLKMNGSTPLAFSYLQAVVYDIIGENYLDHRGLQIKIGLATDVLGFLLAVSLIAPAALAWMKKRAHALSSTVSYIPVRLGVLANCIKALAVLATFGLLLTTLFQLIVTAAFVYPNWKVVTDYSRWEEWDEVNALNEPFDGFLNGYRETVNGFSVVQAVFEPLGLIVACAALLYFAVIEKQEILAQGAGITSTQSKEFVNLDGSGFTSEVHPVTVKA
jgi:hypothetical protein